MKKTVILVVLIFAANGAGATVKPAGLFSDNAVLQQGRAVPVWGTAATGEKVTVQFQNQEVSTIAHNGKWMVKLAPMKAGGSFEMTISGSNHIELTNILIGEVWVCSGQSNMGFQLKDDANAQAAIAAANDPLFRFFSVPNVTSYTPLTDVNSSWQICASDNVDLFSAVAYYFGRDLRQALNVPIGLVWSAWGGHYR